MLVFFIHSDLSFTMMTFSTSLVLATVTMAFRRSSSLRWRAHRSRNAASSRMLAASVVCGFAGLLIGVFLLLVLFADSAACSLVHGLVLGLPSCSLGAHGPLLARVGVFLSARRLRPVLLIDWGGHEAIGVVAMAVFFYRRFVSRFISAAYILHLFSSNSRKSRSLCTSFSSDFTSWRNL